MKKMMWILTVLLLPSLSFAQSRGDMLPFQGPSGSMATLAPSVEPAASEQSVQDKKLSNLSDEGIAFKQAIDVFKSGIGLQLTNEQKRNDAEVVAQVMSVVTEQGSLSQAFASYLAIQQHKMELTQKTVEAASNITSQQLSGQDVSRGYYVDLMINLRLAKKRAEKQRQSMLEERQVLLAYLNQSGDITLADYLLDHLMTSSLSHSDKERVFQWVVELNAAE